MNEFKRAVLRFAGFGLLMSSFFGAGAYFLAAQPSLFFALGMATIPSVFALLYSCEAIWVWSKARCDEAPGVQHAKPVIASIDAYLQDCIVTTKIGTTSEIPAGRYAVRYSTTQGDGVAIESDGVQIEIGYAEWKRIVEAGQVTVA